MAIAENALDAGSGDAPIHVLDAVWCRGTMLGSHGSHCLLGKGGKDREFNNDKGLVSAKASSSILSALNRSSASKSVAYNESKVSTPRFLLVVVGSSIASSSTDKVIVSTLSSVTLVVADSCSLDLNMSTYQGLLFDIVGDEETVVGTSVASNNPSIETVGDIVGAWVVAQIGSLPSMSSGGWQL